MNTNEPMIPDHSRFNLIGWLGGRLGEYALNTYPKGH